MGRNLTIWNQTDEMGVLDLAFTSPSEEAEGPQVLF